MTRLQRNCLSLVTDIRCCVIFEVGALEIIIKPDYNNLDDLHMRASERANKYKCPITQVVSQYIYKYTSKSDAFVHTATPCHPDLTQIFIRHCVLLCN